jgi:1D-myo-inositol-tetrakisphosphate 5-kinase/inositol-polyphosphate multikinase
MDNLRPWRKRTLQIITTERLRKKSEDTVDGEQLPQVGGHGSVDKSQAMQVNRDGLVLKPIQEGPRGEREVEFFKTVTNSSDPTEAVWQEFIPHFYGVSRKVLEDGTKAEYLMMENLTKGFKKPCIMDVKIGAKTYGPDASDKKKAQQDASYAGTKQPFGFSVPGLSVHVGEKKEEVIMKGKEYGRSLNADNIHELLEMYLDINNEPEVAKELAKIFVEDLKKVLQLFEYQTTFHFFASSLLFVYDSEAARNFKETKDGNLRKSCSLKMIDFAHVWKAEGRTDQDYVRGVQSLIMLFQNI